MALSIGFANGQTAVEGGLGVGASTSKGVPADKRSVILEGTITGIGLTVGSWSDDGDHWVEVAQTGVYVRSVPDLEPFLHYVGLSPYADRGGEGLRKVQPNKTLGPDADSLGDADDPNVGQSTTQCSVQVCRQCTSACHT